MRLIIKSFVIKFLKRFGYFKSISYLSYMEKQMENIIQLLESDDKQSVELGKMLATSLLGYTIDFTQEEHKIIKWQFETLGSFNNAYFEHYNKVLINLDICNKQPMTKKLKRIRGNRGFLYYDYGSVLIELIGANFITREAVFRVEEYKLKSENYAYYHNVKNTFCIIKPFPYVDPKDLF